MLATRMRMVAGGECVATDFIATPAPDDPFTHEADFIFELTIDTLNTITPSSYWFRVQDSSNLWYVEFLTNGDWTLNEYVAAFPTQRASAGASSVTDGSHIIMTANDETITGYVDDSQVFTYGSAANFKTETDGKVSTLGNDGVWSDLYTWPITCTEKIP